MSSKTAISSRRFRCVRGFAPGSTDVAGASAVVDVRLSDGSFLVEGRTVTCFANSEEAAADEAVGTKVMPWRIEDALRQRGANYVEGGLWKAVAIGDGRLITGQQQYSDPRSPR
jgi:putative intracellular protease/amidase